MHLGGLLPYISPTSPLNLPCISLISGVHLRRLLLDAAQDGVAPRQGGERLEQVDPRVGGGGALEGVRDHVLEHDLHVLHAALEGCVVVVVPQRRGRLDVEDVVREAAQRGDTLLEGGLGDTGRYGGDIAEI